MSRILLIPILAAGLLGATPPRPAPPARPARPTADEAFCAAMADRYAKCLTGDKDGVSPGHRQRLVKECLKNGATRKALEACARHADCDKFLECLGEKL